MDVAKQLAQWREQSPEQWVRAANRYLPTAVTLLLVIVIAYQLSKITWAVVPGAVPTAMPAPRQQSAPAAAPSSNYASLNASHLFGEAPAESVQQQAFQEVVDAPDTTLSLTLTGILSREGDPNGQAIISANRGQEKTYGIGQSLENANGTTLHSVYADRVLLNRGDRLETLRLPKELVGAASAPQRSPAPMMAPAAAAPESLRNVISQNATSLTNILRLAPHIQEGQVIGFRVNPGRDRATFDALGLVPGDVVTDINGVVLDDASRGVAAFEALGEATTANVTVLRDGTPTVLVVDTSQLQNLQENRE